MTNFPRPPLYVQKAETDDPEKFTIIYDNNPTAKRLIKFNSNLLMNKASLKFVKENFDKIQYVCGKNTLVKTVNYDMDILEKIAVKIGFADLKIPQKSTFKFEIQYDLDEESVEQIFHNYSHNLTEKIGFYINGKSYWMSKMTSRCEVSSNGIMKNSFMPDEEKLLLLLTSQKDDIFSKANVEPI